MKTRWQATFASVTVAAAVGCTQPPKPRPAPTSLPTSTQSGRPSPEIIITETQPTIPATNPAPATTTTTAATTETTATQPATTQATTEPTTVPTTFPSTEPSTTPSTAPASRPTTQPATAPAAGAPATAPAGIAAGQMPEGGPSDFIARDDRADRAPHPDLVAAGSSLPTTTAAIAAILFVLAAVVGPIVRAMAPREVLPTQSHDEPPGSSGRHGHSGTLNPDE